MKKYRRDSRMRKATELERLIELKALLLDEFFGINQEVLYLRNSKELLCELMRDDDDDEYGEYVVVDWVPELQLLCSIIQFYCRNIRIKLIFLIL